MVSPRLFTTADGVRIARERLRSDARAARVLPILNASVQKLQNLALPMFEKDWWEAASRKHWREIYPEANHHTMFAVQGPVSLALDAAMLFALTDDRAAAEAAVRVLMHYSDYEYFVKHPDVGLNWSIWGLKALRAYDLVRSQIEPPQGERIDHFFGRAMEAIRANDQWWIAENPGGLYNNHFAWQKLFVGSYGLFYERDDLVEYALDSEMGVRTLIEQGMRDDGLWFESSLNYQFTAVIPLAYFADAMAIAGREPDLWQTPVANGSKLSQFFTGPIQALFPDRTLPTIGDCYGSRADISRNSIYFNAYSATGDEQIGWLIAGRDIPAEALFLTHLPGKTYTPPRITSRLWPEHGYAALRSREGADYWDGRGYSAFVSYEIDSVHAHRDKFDLMVFGNGAHLAVDPETLSSAQHAFSSNIQAELNRTTLPHNTVMVDGLSHRPVGQKLLLDDWVIGDEVKVVTISDPDGRVAPGVAMSRTVAVCAEYVLDLFQVASEEDHQYDYLYHGVAESGAFELEGALEPVDLGEQGPWKWLREAKGRMVHGGWTAVARQNQTVCRLTFAGHAERQRQRLHPQARAARHSA